MYHNIIKATYHGSKYMQYVHVTLLHTHTYTHTASLCAQVILSNKHYRHRQTCLQRHKTTILLQAVAN